MDQFLITLFCSLFSGYVGFLLGRGGQSTDRRRAFQTEIRVMAEDAGGAHAMYLWQKFGEQAPAVQKLSMAITADVPFWRRSRFKKLRAEYLSLSRDHLRPNGPDESTSKKQWAKPREAMKGLLEDIANAA